MLPIFWNLLSVGTCASSEISVLFGVSTCVASFYYPWFVNAMKTTVKGSGSNFSGFHGFLVCKLEWERNVLAVLLDFFDYFWCWPLFSEIINGRYLKLEFFCFLWGFWFHGCALLLGVWVDSFKRGNTLLGRWPESKESTSGASRIFTIVKMSSK